MNDLEKKKEFARLIAIRCLEINTIGDNDADNENEVSGNPVVFLDLAGHVGKINVRIYKDGWSGDREPEAYELAKRTPLAVYETLLNRLDKLRNEVEEKKSKELSEETDKAVGA